jgi:hypothetical protein
MRRMPRAEAIAQCTRWAQKVGLDLRFHPRWIVEAELPAQPVSGRARKPSRFKLYADPRSYLLSFEHQGRGSYFRCDGGTPWAQPRTDAWKLGQKAGGDLVELRGFRLLSLGRLLERLEREHDLRFDLAAPKVKARAAPAGARAKVEAWFAGLATR